jgi:hypothetical protein
MLKTWSKQLLGSFLLAFTLPSDSDYTCFGFLGLCNNEPIRRQVACASGRIRTFDLRILRRVFNQCAPNSCGKLAI